MEDPLGKSHLGESRFSSIDPFANRFSPEREREKGGTNPPRFVKFRWEIRVIIINEIGRRDNEERSRWRSGNRK